ncbi:MAG: hypothetical protein UU32_C0005G0002 [Candidatus Woesebacteria bacterium GW2011_GWB1_41_10]|uniref:ATPase n=1 Tax=Candidatus Woesebacteria bacterium GW2011_GWB1_41_10 TaxID=1618577 RepID=A0A0G0UEV2_9BACT|nr:MAG: hypothetical protein UU32_C0005G0002 [Candidatus Woesebacteria bacterium GW2011_GWB1_41_10]
MDEIQYVDGWNSLLKYYFDLYPQLKIVVSGSASLFIHTSAKESLAGRIQELVMRPMGYGEYLRINSKEDSEINFRHYLSWGEFPYLEKLPGWEEKSEYVNEFVFKKVVEHDLPKLKKVYGNELSNMLKLLITHSGQIIEIQNLAADLGIAQNTAREYLKLLEDTHLISQVFNLGLGFRTRSMKQRKVYGSSVNAQVLSSIGSIDSEIWSKDIGLIIETFVYNHLLRKSSGDIVFWRQRQVREVDFVLVSSGEKLPIEVKYQNQLKRKDLDNILYYCEKEKLKKAMVVTKFESGVKKIGGVKIDFRPANMLMD